MMLSSKLKWFMLVFSLLVAFDGRAFCAPTTDNVPPVRLAALSKGIDLGGWFSQTPDGDRYTHDHFRNWITSDELLALHRSGFTHVRFPVEFEMFFDEQHPSVLNPEFLPDFDHALDEILASGLAVDVDFHAREDTTKKRMCTDDAFVAKLVLLWGAVAHHLAGQDPNRVFLEIMNEPIGCMSLSRWLNIQGRFLAAIRAADPDKTIIVNADYWDSIDELVKMKPLSDRNLVYTFHFYEPIFTRQGATWAKFERPIMGLAYPANAANKIKVANKVTDHDLRARILAYNLNRNEIADKIAVAARWGRLHSVPLYCGEFGAYAKFAPRESRLRWIKDVREILEQDGIGWAMWSYTGGFGIALGDSPPRPLDRDLLTALGLLGP